jgi:hypothetical protein
MRVGAVAFLLIAAGTGAMLARASWNLGATEAPAPRE